MSATSSVRLSFRCAGLRFPARGSRSGTLQPLRSNVRSFSSRLQIPYKLTFDRIPSCSRNFSLWPTSKPPSTVQPPTPSPNPATDQSKGTLVDQVPEASSTESLSSVEAVTSAPSAVDSTNITDSATSVDASSVLDAVVQHAGPIQWGDFAALGLAGYSPAGIIRWSFEVINVATQLPWFWTIVAGSAFWRLVCIPLTIKASRNAAKLAPHQETIKAMQAKMNRSAQNPAMKMQVATELSAFYKKHNINPLGAMVGLAQLPITLGLFFAVKGLCEFPLEQLKDSGFALLPDLTTTDPTLILPIMMTVAVNLQLLLSARDVTSNMKPMLYFFHVLTVPGFFIMKALPSGLIISLLTTTFMTGVQMLLFRIPAVRSAFKMPPPVPQKPGQSPIAEFRKLIAEVRGDDIKDKVSNARREAARIRPSLQSPKSK